VEIIPECGLFGKKKKRDETPPSESRGNALFVQDDKKLFAFVLFYPLSSRAGAKSARKGSPGPSIPFTFWAGLYC
jgi:hypothetical protein